MLKLAQSSRTWASLMNKAQPYKNISCPFIHDDRGRFCPQGSTAWLRPVRAKKIIDECEARGISGAITPVNLGDDSGAGSESLTPPLSETPSSGSAPFIARADMAAKFLSMHHTRRKKIARLLGAEGKVTSSEADKVIRSAESEELRNLAQLIQED